MDKIEISISKVLYAKMIEEGFLDECNHVVTGVKLPKGFEKNELLKELIRAREVADKKVHDYIFNKVNNIQIFLRCVK